MASGVDVKMGVSGISQFKSAMSQAQQSVKTLDAALKLNEKQLQTTGDKETYMQNKSKLLQQQIKAQTAVVKQGEQALSAMEKNGVNPASQAYQRMQQQVLTAQASLLGMQGQLSNVGSAAEQTAQKTDDLSASVNSINKKVSFDAVLNGIGKITDGMERAARRIADFAKDAWHTMADAASWADDENTLAAMYGLDVETLQRMQGASRTIDTSVEAIVKSRQKLKQSMVSDSKDIKAAFQDLGVSVSYGLIGKEGEKEIFRDWEDVFWDTGAALLAFTDDVQKDVYANQIFGKSWMELMPLFQAGREEYEKTLAEQSVVSEENVNKLNELDDALQTLNQDFSTLKSTVLSELAPAFTDLASGFSGLVKQFNEYLQTDEGKEKMEALGEAASRLFDGLTDIDAGAAIDTVAGGLDSVTGALEWIKNNQGVVVGAIKAIGAAFLAMKAAEIGLTLAQVVSGWKDLLGKGAQTQPVSVPQTQPQPVTQTQPQPVTQTQPQPVTQTQPEPVTQTQPEPVSQQKPVRAPKIKPVKDSSLTHQGIGTTLLQTAGFVIIPAVAIDSVVSEVNMQLEDSRKAAEERERIKAVEEQMSASGAMQNAGYAELWALMNSPYTEGNTNPFVDMPERYRAWLYDDAEDAMMDAMAEIFSDRGGPLDELWEQYAGLMEKYLAGENVYDLENVAQLWESMRAAIEQAGAENKITVPAELNPDLAGLQEQLDSKTLTIQVAPYMGPQLDTSMPNVDGSHANGLPFVPFDGYIAALHRGERVVPANQNKSYTANSNLYVEKMYMNGVNAQGLAAAMAAENRRVRSGFGS